MQTKIVVENGEVTLDAVDGTGQECRTNHAKYIAALKKEFGLPDTAVTEDCKPEMEALVGETNQLGETNLG